MVFNNPKKTPINFYGLYIYTTFAHDKKIKLVSF